MYMLPHFIAVDHLSKSVVVGIRGTKCILDVLTDLVCEDTPIKIEPRRLMYMGHRGMVESANQINRQITNILSAVLEEHSNYGLVVTGGTVNKAAAIDTEAFCMTVVIGDDVVSRLSVHSVELIIGQIWDELWKCKIPKYRVLLGQYPENEHDSERNLDPERGIDHAESRLLHETQLPYRLTEPENSFDEIHSTEPIQEEPIKETEEEVRIEISPAESISQESQEEKREKENKDKEVNDHITKEKVSESKKEAVDEGEPSTSKKNHDFQSDKMDDSPSDSEEQVKVDDKEVNDHITKEKVSESKKEGVDEGEPSTSKKNNDSQSDKMDDSPSDSEEQLKIESVLFEIKVRFTVLVQEEPIKETEEEVRIEISPAESISQESQEEKLEKENEDTEVNDHITKEKVSDSKKEAVDEGEPSTNKKNNDSQSDKMDDSPSDSEEQFKVEPVPSEIKVTFTVSTPEHDQENAVAEEAVREEVEQEAVAESELFIPGKVLHINPRTNTDSEGTQRVKLARRIEFRKIIISDYVIKDHSSETVKKIFQKVCNGEI
ncbi:myb-like protein X isoform X2 [Artemia franciscana]|uniref:sn-1-specific diacylglycerol lipase n=1 Tax=Artemia franciscana TaxID=6661 RepID=A0AA88H6L5_ARTSF|nr:hypothetical protein QYM36_018543 [Artemia franciscana]